MSDAIRNLQVEASRLKEDNRLLREDLTALRASVRALRQLHHQTRVIDPQVDVRALLGSILNAALTVLKAGDGSLILLDEDTGELVFTVAQGAAAEALVGYRLPAGAGIAGWVAAHQEPQIVRNAQLDPRFSPLVDQQFNFSTQSLVCVPLVYDDRVMGVIEAVNKQTDNDFDEEDLDLLVIVAQIAALALARAERATEPAESVPASTDGHAS